MNPSEERFKFLYRRRLTILRPSWPDFLCVDREGRLFAVEVKSPTDDLSKNQVRTFDLLEYHNALKVKMWHRGFPNQLWRWDQAKQLRPWIRSLLNDD